MVYQQLEEVLDYDGRSKEQKKQIWDLIDIASSRRSACTVLSRVRIYVYEVD
jgi:hypothetical protein